MNPFPAPTASFVDETGATVSLESLMGQKTLVLYFYPKDETPGCTVEACTFRDQYEDFVAAGAEVIGVSADDAASHEAFKAKHRLPFRLLTDPGGLAAKAFGVKKTLGLLPGRVTFVIDRGRDDLPPLRLAGPRAEARGRGAVAGEVARGEARRLTSQVSTLPIITPATLPSAFRPMMVYA